MRLVVLIALLAGCAVEREQDSCVDCQLGVHVQGWLDPKSDAFHGKDIARRGWDFPLCQSCHGENYEGKPGAPSCLGCHANGPTACDTCHGTPPASGAHLAHATRGLACGECHVVPSSWSSPGHLLDDNHQPIQTPAKVTFGELAQTGGANPAWDHAGGTCSGVYCHGGAFADAAATNPQPQWAGGPSQVACGSCHGTAPASHAQSECATCHPSSARHVDGIVDVGAGCSDCHGDTQSAAPPRGLHGETATSALAVGAHRAHLVAGRLRGPIACAECHLVPDGVDAPGHIDSSLPAELVFGTLATKDGATPMWNRATATCSAVYCHGGGTHLVSEPSSGKLATQTWTANATTTIYCGACHGLPPSDAFHASTLQLTDCATCHSGTVGPFGNILVGNGKHINGAIDFD